MGTVIHPEAASSVHNEDEFRLLANAIPNLAWMALPDGYIYWYNDRWFQYTGTTPADMEGWGWQSVHHPETLEEVRSGWQRSIDTGVPFEMTFPLRAADGQFRTFLTRVVPLKNPDGQLIRWFGTNTDVTQQIEAATALRESEQRFRIATEAVSGILWTNDPTGEMRGEQTRWSEFTGQTFEQYQGYGWASAVHPDDAQASVEAWQDAVREQRLFAFEHRVRRHDGEYRLCSIRALPIRTDAGHIREWVGVHTDITEDRRTKDELRVTVSRLKDRQELLEVAQFTNSIGFWRFQPSTGELYLSSGSRRLVGLPAEGEITVGQFYRNVDADDLPRMRAALDEARSTGSYRCEFRTLDPDSGNTAWILGAARVLFNPDGDLYYVGINMDITQQKQNAEALIRSEKLAVAGRLAATVAHEINNPLEAVTNLLYLVLQTDLDDEQRGYCVTMSDELKRVASIANHTLGFHRQATRPGHVSLTALIDSVLSLYAGRLRNSQIESNFTALHECGVFGFDGELRQVLANLIGNAVDAMTACNDRRSLIIRCRSAASPRTGLPGAVITIADTGCGIPQAARNRIFEAFYTTKGHVGTGLGLWVTGEIIRKHQGTLQVRSSQLPAAHGTVFRVFLPDGPQI